MRGGGVATTYSPCISPSSLLPSSTERVSIDGVTTPYQYTQQYFTSVVKKMQQQLPSRPKLVVVEQY